LFYIVVQTDDDLYTEPMDRIPPQLIYEDLLPTRDYLQEVALVLGNLQRAFIPKDPRDWHYGLEVGLRGLLTQPMIIGGKEVRASLDLVPHKVRLGDSSWSLDTYAAPEIFNNIQIWLESHTANVTVTPPKFTAHARRFNSDQSTRYGNALWWMYTQLDTLKKSFKEGVTAPILLYPHHFDLALVWFPWDDERQLAIGFSTGDRIIAEPYVYLTAYPEPEGFTDLSLPGPAYWQADGFSGAILPYHELSSSTDPVKLFRDYAQATITAARALLG
jgi:hypothetical protein